MVQRYGKNVKWRNDCGTIFSNVWATFYDLSWKMIFAYCRFYVPNLGTCVPNLETPVPKLKTCVPKLET